MKIISIAVFLLAATASYAQNATVLVPQKTTPPPAATPATPASDGDARRAAALAKVKGTTAPAMEAKGDPSPVAYSYGSAEAQPASTPATTVTVNGEERLRDVRKGKGQVHFGQFTPVNELHFVQFGVFCNDAPVTHAPAVEGVYLVWHAESTCPGGTKGAAYIVKGFPSAEEAKAEVRILKAQGIDCWYNPVLTGTKVEIIGVR